VCKSRNASVVCGAGGCIDAIVEHIAPQLPKDYPCAMSQEYMKNCITPFISPMSAAGANLMALVGCDQAAAAVRLQGKIPCVGPAAAAAAPAAKPDGKQ
jgi:hypothetical protein